MVLSEVEETITIAEMGEDGKETIRVSYKGTVIASSSMLCISNGHFYLFI